MPSVSASPTAEQQWSHVIAERSLRVLLVEDSPDDAALVIRTLKATLPNASFDRVETAPALKAALDGQTWDMIISDHGLPGWSGLEALQVLQSTGRDIPFLLVSGTIGEETAVAAMKAGAHDYLLKDKLARLGVAAVRELREAEERRERRRAQEALRFLAGASVTLAETLDQTALLGRLARLAVPFVADWCLVDLGEHSQLLQRAAAAHTDAGQQVLVEAMEPSLIPGPAGATALRTHEPQYVDSNTGGTSPYLVVPLVSRGRAAGVMTLGLRAGDGPPRPADVELAQELGRRACQAMENARLYREAQEAIRLRDEFIGIASHELRTPLTPLQLQIQVMLRLLRKHEATPERISLALEMSHRQVQRLTRLIDQLLNVSRITAGHLDLSLEPVDLAALVRDVSTEFQHEMADAGCTLRVDAPRPIMGTWDRARLTQVVSSLLSNAAKFGGGKPIEVALEQDADGVRMRITDHGVGISTCDQQKLFQRFGRVVSVRNYGGFGLGLWLVRQILEAHGGSVSVQSSPDEGATFVAELPATPMARSTNLMRGRQQERPAG